MLEQLHNVKEAKKNTPMDPPAPWEPMGCLRDLTPEKHAEFRAYLNKRRGEVGLSPLPHIRQQSERKEEKRPRNIVDDDPPGAGGLIHANSSPFKGSTYVAAIKDHALIHGVSYKDAMVAVRDLKIGSQAQERPDNLGGDDWVDV